MTIANNNVAANAFLLLKVNAGGFQSVHFHLFSIFWQLYSHLSDFYSS